MLLGSKLLPANGFYLIHEQILQKRYTIIEPNESLEVAVRDFKKNYFKTFRYILNLNDLLTFLNWKVSEQIALQLDIILNWIKNANAMVDPTISEILIRDQTVTETVQENGHTILLINLKEINNTQRYRTRKSAEIFKIKDLENFTTKTKTSSHELKSILVDLNSEIKRFNSNNDVLSQRLQRLRETAKLSRNKIAQSLHINDLHKNHLSAQLLIVQNRIGAETVKMKKDADRRTQLKASGIEKYLVTINTDSFNSKD